MGDNPRTSDEYIALADHRRTYFQQHTPPRSPSSFEAGANEIEEAELSQLLIYTPEPSNHHLHRSWFSSSSESSRRRLSNSKRRKIQLFIIYLGLALSTGLLLGAVVGSKKGGELVGKYKDLAVGQLTQALGASKGAGSGLGAEDGYDDLEQYLKSGNATDGFGENLREELGYVTTWNSAGMTNVFEGYCNLLYLALITQRIPIIPPLVPSPSHLGFDKPLPMINFGEVFDLPRLRRALRSPILEWKDVKRAHYGEPWSIKTPPMDGVVEEELGCWSTDQVIRGRWPHRTSLETFLKLDVAYTPVPLSVAVPRFPDQSTFWGLAYLTFSHAEESVGCTGKWEVPPFIAVNIRRDDFDSGWCRSHPEAECHPPLNVFRNRVRQVQEALAEKFGPVTKLGNVHDVIVTSDEKNATWWGQVRRMGWVYIDHGKERTAELYGTWYPAIIDAVVQSMSIGFVGTQGSTMSRVAALRVRDWNGGVTRMVHWSQGKGERREFEGEKFLEPLVD
ncbi:hypothetical protein FS837_001244 [Tulasnella sp. UAMH 9824]|nr:hypothetical protein FS837_001244 [Tulasnella sp. UAMH 9824]